MIALTALAWTQSKTEPTLKSQKNSHAQQTGQTQDSGLVPLSKSVSAGNVQCDQNWLSSRSATLVSPAGTRATLELRGKTIQGQTKDDNQCATTWIVHLVVNGLPKTITVGTKEDEWYYEHLFEMNGWSKNGNLLLMSMIAAAGDWDETTPVVYDVVKDKVWRTELAPLFNSIVPDGCLVYFRPLGFSESGKVLLDVGPLDADDLAPREKPCFQKSIWELDYTQRRVTRVSDAATVVHFGTVVAGPD